MGPYAYPQRVTPPLKIRSAWRFLYLEGIDLYPYWSVSLQCFLTRIGMIFEKEKIADMNDIFW